MRIKELKNLLQAEVILGEENSDEEIYYGFGSDLMSDVLTYVDENTALLTGLTCLSAIRTAEMLDVSVIIFVRGKSPAEDIINLAVERDMTLLKTDYTLYEACGILYNAGLRPCKRG